MYQYDLCRFGESVVFGGLPAGARQEAIADKQLVREGEITFLVESLNHTFFRQAVYPVVWDYEQDVSGGLSADETWYANTIYSVTDNLTIEDGATLRIEPGTIVKLYSGKKITTASGGRLIARGTPYMPIVFEPYSDSFYCLEIGEGSEIEFCRIRKASTAIRVSGIPGIPIRHNHLSYCGTGVAVLADVVGADHSLSIFNNLIVGDPCDAPPNDPCGLPIGIWIADPCDVGKIHIYNNTLWGMGHGIRFGTLTNGLVYVKDNIFAKCDCGIYAPAGMSYTCIENNYNGYYANTVNVGGGAYGVGLGVNSAIATEEPFYSHYHYLNTNANGGAKFTNAGSQAAMAAYSDPYDWAVRSPSQSPGHAFTTATTLDTDTTWEPNPDVCDIGVVDMGYHHPRIDYYIFYASITVDGGSGSRAILTIKPGTVIAHYVCPSTGVGKLEIDGDTGDQSEDGTGDGLVCVGEPFGGGYVTWVNSYRAFASSYTTSPYSNTKPFVVLEQGSSYDVRFTEFQGLGWALQVEEGQGTLRDNRFFLNTRPIYAVGCEGLEIANCLFACNNLAVLDYEGAGGLLVEGGTFDRNSRSINIAGSTSTSATIRNCLFTEYDFGIRKNNLNATITENHNAFRSTLQDSRAYCEYVPPNINDLDPNSTDRFPAVCPYDPTWADFADRFHLVPDCNVVDTGYDPDQIGMVGYTTRLDMQVDDPNRDIGYHYPLDRDTDRDGLMDYEEYWLGVQYGDNTMYLKRDSDGDGLTDYEEVVYGTDPTSADMDGDGIPDWWEVQFGAPYADPFTADADSDYDGDELTNLQEYQNGLSPTVDNRGDSWTQYQYPADPNVADPNYVEVLSICRVEVSGASILTTAETHITLDRLGRTVLEWKLADPGGGEDSLEDEITETFYDKNGVVTMVIRERPGGSYQTGKQTGDLATEYAYDAVGRVTEVTDPLGNVTAYAYDAAGRQTKITQPGNRETITLYDPAGRATKVTDAEGHYREMTYDSRGHVVKQVLKNASHTAIQQDRWYYNNVGDLTRQVTMADPDATGDPSTSTDRVIDYAYSYTSAARTRFTYTYDGTSTFTAYSTTSSEDKSGRGLPTQIMQGQASGHARILEKRYYDKAGRVTKTIRENRDAADTAQVTVTTLMTYDAHGRMQYSIADGGQGNTLTTVYAYDGDDRQVWVRNPKGYWTYSGYDALGRLTQKIEDVDETYGINRVTDYQYDRLGRLVTLIAENSSTGNQTTIYTYDLGDRVVDIKYPDGDSVAFAYGTIGKVTQRIDQASVTTSYTYDKLGRLTQKYRLGQSGTDIREVYAYDARGLMTTAKKGDASPYTSISSDTLSYNALGALTQSAQSVFGTSKTITYNRDTLGQAARITYPDAGSTQMNFTYTSLGQVNQVSKASDLIVDYAYYGSLVYTRDYDNADVTQTATYDSFGRISTLNTVNSSNAGVRFAYTYDDNGNILSKRFNHRSGTPSNIYSYDRLDRLTQARYLVGVLTEDEEFEYDPLGNRVSMEDRGDNTIAYAANTVNEYTTIGGVGVAYDACGNLSEDAAGYQYFYDHDNRLTQVQDSGDNVKAEYAYDATGRRIRTILGGTTTKYYYDGQRVLLETDNAGTEQRRFVYGNYIDEVLCMIDYTANPDADYYYGHDHLFSVCVLFGYDQGEEEWTVAERYEYDAYGSVHILSSDFCILSSSQYSNPYTFTGRRLDLLDAGALPLMYYRARMYNPPKGRFLHRDPVGYADGINLYEYVRSCPIYYVDFTGEGPSLPGPGVPWPPPGSDGCTPEIPITPLPGPGAPEEPQDSRGVCIGRFALAALKITACAALKSSEYGWAMRAYFAVCPKGCGNFLGQNISLSFSAGCGAAMGGRFGVQSVALCDTKQVCLYWYGGGGPGVGAKFPGPDISIGTLCGINLCDPDKYVGAFLCPECSISGPGVGGYGGCFCSAKDHGDRIGIGEPGTPKGIGGGISVGRQPGATGIGYLDGFGKLFCCDF